MTNSNQGDFKYSSTAVSLDKGSKVSAASDWLYGNETSRLYGPAAEAER